MEISRTSGLIYNMAVVCKDLSLEQLQCDMYRGYAPLYSETKGNC